MSTIATHKNYQDHKDDPLVLLLMKQIESKPTITVPPIWERLIRKSTEHSDINLILSQLPYWGVKSNIDVNLRGEELLRAIHDSMIFPIFEETDRYLLANVHISWPRALESILQRKGIIKTEGARKLVTKSNMTLHGDLTYVETGTIKYSVTRRIPKVVLTVPNAWILEHCSPDTPDVDMITQFHAYYHNGFATPEQVKEGGFGLREVWKKVLRFTERTKWDSSKMTSSMDGVFPQQIQIQKWREEPIAYLNLEGCIRSSMRADEDVAKRNVKFHFSEDRNGRHLNSEIRFPVLDADDRNEAERQGIRIVSSRRKFFGRLGETRFDDGVCRPDLIRALREIYKEINDAKQYDEMREKIG